MSESMSTLRRPAGTPLEQVACDLCGSESAHYVLSCVDKNWRFHGGKVDAEQQQQNWQLVECDRCGLVFLNPRPKLAALSQYYPGNYYSLSHSRSATAGSLKSTVRRFCRKSRGLWTLLQHTRQIGERLQDPITREIGYCRPGRFLDIGCGSGALLDELQVLGWDTFGVELSAAAAAIARQNGHNVWDGNAASAPLPEAHFDAVHISHCLEHVSSPVNLLRAARKCIKPGGLLLVEVPDFGSAWTRLFGGNAWYLDLPRHLYHFTESTLTACLEKCGFSVRSCRKPMAPNGFLLSVLHSSEGGSIATQAERDVIAKVLLSCDVRKELESFCNRMESVGMGSAIRVVATPATVGDHVE